MRSATRPIERPDPPLHYRLDGAGRHLLLLHPVGLDLTFFDPLVAYLSPYYRVLRVDLRGHGGSAPAHSAPLLRDHAADIHDMLQRLSFAPAAVIGFSLGGMLAQTLALLYPSDVRALVVGACPGTFPAELRPVIAERGALAERDGMAAVVDATLERWFSTPFRRSGGDQAARQRLLTDDVRSWGDAWRAIAALDTAPRLRSIAVPTLCVAGEADCSAPPPVVAAVAAAIRGARFTIVAGAPHMLFIEQPRLVAEKIAGFLADVL